MKLTFTAWMERLDLYMMTELGITHKGIPEMPYKDWYNDGVTPIKAADWALREAKMI